MKYLVIALLALSCSKEIKPSFHAGEQVRLAGFYTGCTGLILYWSNYSKQYEVQIFCKNLRDQINIVNESDISSVILEGDKACE